LRLNALNALNAAVRLIAGGNRAGFSGWRYLILLRAGLTGRARWACLIRITRWPRLPRLAFARGSGLSTLTRCAWLALGLGKRGINVAVYVPRLVIVVTAIIGIMHVIHL